MASPANSRYSQIIREFDALSTCSSNNVEELPILDREDNGDLYFSNLPALSSSASSTSSHLSFPSISPHTGARWYDDHDFDPLSTSSSISSPPTELPVVSSEFLHDALIDTCSTHYSDQDHGHDRDHDGFNPAATSSCCPDFYTDTTPPSSSPCHLERPSSSCSGASSCNSTLPTNPPPSLCGFPLDGIIDNGTATMGFSITEEDFRKLQNWAWEAIGNGNISNSRSTSPIGEKRRRLQVVRKAGGAVHKKLEKAMGEIFKR